MGKSNGILTETQRKYLQGNHEPPSDSAERKMRSDIRTRTLAVIDDLSFVAQHLDTADLELLFQEPKSVSTFEAAEEGRSIPEKSIAEYQNRIEAYKDLISILAFFYEVHWRKGWDFSDALQLAIERAHGRKSVQGENPRGLPRRRVDKEEFQFNPALESVESYGDKRERILKKWREGEEPLTDEERLFLYDHYKWDDINELAEFRKQQRKSSSSEVDEKEFFKNQPWVLDKE